MPPLNSDPPRQLKLAGVRMRAVKPGRKIISRLRSALAVSLVLWCAGAGCMLVSYARTDAMSGASAANASGSAEPSQVSGSMGAHKCCKARHASERRLASSDHASSSDSFADLEGLAEFPNSSNAMSCCPLTSGTFVVNSRQRISNDDVSVSPGAEAASIITRFAATPLAMPLRLPDQNQTYLRGCVFLI